MTAATTSGTDIFDLDIDLIAETDADESTSYVTRFGTQDACGTCTPTWGAAMGERCP